MFNLLKKIFGFKANEQSYVLPSNYKHLLPSDDSKYLNNNRAIHTVNGKKVSFSVQEKNAYGNKPSTFASPTYHSYSAQPNSDHHEENEKDYIGFFKPQTVGKGRAQQWTELGRF